jgi:hypothetical protein
MSANFCSLCQHVQEYDTVRCVTVKSERVAACHEFRLENGRKEFIVSVEVLTEATLKGTILGGCYDAVWSGERLPTL